MTRQGQLEGAPQLQLNKPHAVGYQKYRMRLKLNIMANQAREIGNHAEYQLVKFGIERKGRRGEGAAGERNAGPGRRDRERDLYWHLQLYRSLTRFRYSGHI